MLILDIFAQHATSRDGKLQVELAQLQYALPRLVEKNTMMSRLWTRRHRLAAAPARPSSRSTAAARASASTSSRSSSSELADDRRLRRQRRGEREVPIIAICGYTNAGKSTLLNALTEGDALAADKLFATLDPISRRLRFPHEREVVITDTVGLHPRSAEGPDRARSAPRSRSWPTPTCSSTSSTRPTPIAISTSARSRASSRDLGLGDKPRILVWNKADRLEPTDAEHLARHGGGFVVSALDRATFGPLLLAIERALWQQGKDTQVARVVHA